MKENEYLRLRAEAEARYKRDLDAIERVWRLSGGAAISKNNATAQRGKGDLVKAIKVAIENLEGEFTAHDVVRLVRETHPQFGSDIKASYVSLVLRRLVERHKGQYILQSKEAQGTNPASYKRPGSTQDALLAELMGTPNIEETEEEE